MVIDDQLLYIGSHNVYPANLQEYGTFIEDKDALNDFLQNYWQHAWKYSKDQRHSFLK